MLRYLLLTAAIGLAVLSASAGDAQHNGTTRFPSADPNPRVGTPDDPEFDCAEPDDEDLFDPLCTSVYSEQFRLFGFAPAATRATALYHDPGHIAAGELSQRSGISADRAWKTSTGRADVAIAIIDTGIVWSRESLRLKIWLNQGELPLPQLPGGGTASQYDANADGAFNVADYDGDPRVDAGAGPNGIAGAVDGQDLLAAFSDGIDADANGFEDDIAGWDFFDDDNDPYDASSYSSAENHGSGRAAEAAQQTDDGEGGAAVCPQCQVMILRGWDTFAMPADNYAMATLYAADNGAAVQEVALGVLQNSQFSQAATQYAFERGMALMQVSSDLNTSDHNYPTNYNNTVFVAGTVSDTFGLGQEAPPQMAQFLQPFGLGTNAPAGTWFRNSNLTQFGGHAHIVMVGDTGSNATGQASGAAGLVVSRGRELAGAIGGPLTSNEVKQILTQTAEDVLPENTLGTGAPDLAQPGWDQHFGYGRVDLGAAVARVAPGTIPPEAGIESPAWFMPLDPVTDPTVPIAGFARAERVASYTYELAYAPGLEPLAQAFTTFATGSGAGGESGTLGTLPLSAVAALLPGAAQGVPPLDPYQYAFTVRLRVTDNLGNVGEDRKTLFAYHDPTLHAGWPKHVDTGGDSSLRFADLDADGDEEVISANSSGRLAVWNHDGTPFAGFNGGQPFASAVPALIANHTATDAIASGDVAAGRSGFTTPAIGDLDRDGLPEIVAVAGDRVYALRGDGSLVSGFPVAVNPSFSAPSERSHTNHVKTGIFGSPVLADLDEDGKLDIVVAALDQRVYAWSASGSLLPGWPVFAQDPNAIEGAGAESINTPAIADIDGDGHLDVIVPTNEFYQAGRPAPSPGGLLDALRKGAVDLAAGGAGLVSSRVYAIHHDGTAHDGVASDDGGDIVDADAFLAGWPVQLNGIADILPLIGPGFDPVVVDVDGGPPEVIAGSTLGEMIVFGGNGVPKFNLRSNAAPGINANPGTIVNMFEYPAVGDVTGAGTLGVFKGGLPVEGLANLVAVGQNLPFTHVVQGWSAQTGQPLPGWPRATDDWQLLSSPSIANVAGGPEREVIVGTGLYLLHAYGPTGIESPGFPKFTGGWLFGTTPVADIDGDGLLEIANWTREGNMFVWDTDAPACGGNSEWWGFRHDDRNTGRYGNDTRAPRAVRDFALAGDGTYTARWTAPGDDTVCGTAARYEVRYASSPITGSSWAQASELSGEPSPQAPGSPETFTLPALPPGTNYLAVRTFDEAGNPSPVSNALTVCGSDIDCDTVLDSSDNCRTVANTDQRNSDANFIDLAPYGRPTNDETWPNSDEAGDACDTDDDNDGLSDAVETAGAPCASATAATDATDATRRDTDADRVLDGAECALGSDPRNATSRPAIPAATADTDRDRLTDTFEVTVLGTDPSKSDTDGDGFSDGSEVKGYNSNPLAVNTDGDLCADGKEVASVNPDEVVNALDLGIVASAFGHETSSRYVVHFDANKDGAINALDLGLVAAQFGFC